MLGLGKRGMVPVKVTIVADEGYGLSRNSTQNAMKHEKYIVDVHPDGEPPFRTEVKVWVSWPEYPQPGDVVNGRYKPGTKDVEIVLDGDPRFDRKLRQTDTSAQDPAVRDALLNAPPDTPPPT